MDMDEEKCFKRKQSKVIEKLSSEQKWEEVRALLLELLKNDPNDHWLLTQLSETYYEEKRYEESLLIVARALIMAPYCPLVLWDYAGTFDMLERDEEAIAIYKRLIGRGVSRLAYGECGEGIRWARSLVNDCRYRLGLIYARVGKYETAQKYIKIHIRFRSNNCSSIYKLRDVRKDLISIQEGKNPRKK